MLKYFKIIALLEGISLLVLLVNMIVVKPNHLGLYKTLLYPIGWSHGFLFMAYIALAILLKFSLQWSFKKLAVVCFASFVPFGTFYIERKML